MHTYIHTYIPAYCSLERLTVNLHEIFPHMSSIPKRSFENVWTCNRTSVKTCTLLLLIIYYWPITAFQLADIYYACFS